MNLPSELLKAMPEQLYGLTPVQSMYLNDTEHRFIVCSAGRTAILPVILIIIDVIESIVCLSVGNYPKSLYWFSAGILTLSTILMK